MYMIKEDFLHYIWKYRLFDTEYFYFRNKKVVIIDPGRHNFSSGPDFFNARIRIGETLWAGNVEIHVKASDWFRHNHQEDPAYDNIILHFVYDPDMAVYRRNGEEIPFVRATFHPRLLKTYEQLIKKRENPDCYHVFARMDAVFYYDWTGKLGLGRLERRIEEIHEKLIENHFNWDEVLYQCLASSFGANQNSEPFLLLSRSVPLKFVYKNRSNPTALNAAFFGQAGYLDETLTDDAYYQQLQREYKSLKTYLPDPLPGKHLWKLMRLRPPSFPVVRIPQFICLVRNAFPLMSNLLKMNEVRKLADFLRESVANYWTDHFLYGISGRRPEYMPSLNTCRLWILNAIIPIIFCYGKVKKLQGVSDYAIHLMEELPPENNEILKIWNKFGIKAKNAFDSQALIELKTRYCESRKCIDCMIGHKILSDARSEED